MPDPQPSVGGIVHYVSRGSADGVYPSVCRAALVTDVLTPYNIAVTIFNPEGMNFHSNIDYNPDKAPGTWHWPETVA